jgi:hypothetical protein
MQHKKSENREDNYEKTGVILERKGAKNGKPFLPLHWIENAVIGCRRQDEIAKCRNRLSA